MLTLLLTLLLAAPPERVPLPDTIPATAGPDAPAMLRGTRDSGPPYMINDEPVSPRFRDGATTALGLAAYRGDVEAMAWLVERGIPVDGLPDEGRGRGVTPLDFAAGQGRVEAARWLIDAGASIEDDSPVLPLRQGPLVAAVPGPDDDEPTRQRHRQVMRLLLDAGADPDAGGPLVRAAAADDLAAVDLLLAAGAAADGPTLTKAERELLDRHRGSIQIRTPLAVAAVEGHDRIVARLIEAGAATEGIEVGRSPVALRARLAAGQPLTLDADQRARLPRSDRRDRGEFARLLLDDRGRDGPSFPGGDGGDALLLAAVAADVDMLRALIEDAGLDDPAALGHALAAVVSYADPRPGERDARDVLLPPEDDAARAEAVTVLADAGAAEALPADGWRYVLTAAGSNATEILAALGAAGLSGEATTRDLGEEATAHLQFYVLAQPAAVERMADAGLELDLTLAAALGHLDRVDDLLGDGVDANGVHFGAPVLAAYNGHADVLRKLLAAGADPNLHAGERGGFHPGSPLDGAIAGNHEDIVRLLLDAGAKVDVPDRQGTTPLARASGRIRTMMERHAGAETR